MTKIYVIGIGYRPLDKKASEVVCNSDIVLANKSLLDIFREYKEYDRVKDRVRVLENVEATMNFLRTQIEDAVKEVKMKDPELRTISLLAAGDPMFFGIGRVIIDEFGKDIVEIMPDLSSIQVAFARIKETWHNAFLMSVHGGPDPAKRRKLEYDLGDIPTLLKKYDKIAILTDKINNPAEISKALKSSPETSDMSLVIFVCERLGFPDEKIIGGAPDDISSLAFAYPNVMIIKKITAQNDIK